MQAILLTKLPNCVTPRNCKSRKTGVSVQILSLALSGHFPGEAGLANFTEATDDGSGGDNCSYKSCKLPVKLSPTNKSTPNFLQTGYPSCRPTNTVTALKGKYHIPRTCSSHARLTTPSYLGEGCPGVELIGSIIQLQTSVLFPTLPDCSEQYNN